MISVTIPAFQKQAGEILRNILVQNFKKNTALIDLIIQSHHIINIFF